MADNKGGSDLDIFDELAKKKEPSSLGSSPGSFGGAPPPPPPIPSRPPGPGPIVHHKTLLGMPNPFLPGAAGAPPPPPPTIQVPGPISAPPPPPVPGSAVAGQPYPPPPPPIKAQDAGVEMNWDDDDDDDDGEEEEKTTIFRTAEVDQEVTRVAPPMAAATPFTPLPPAPAPLAPFSSRPAPKPPMPLSTPPLSGQNPFMLGAPPSRAPLPLQVPSVGLTSPGLGSRQTIPPSSGLSRPPLRTPSLPAPPTPSARSYAPPPPDILVSAPPKAPRRSGLWVVVGLVAVAGAAAYFLMPRTGKILIVAAGEAGRPLERVTILIDGTKKCEVVPCTLELDKGVHIAKAAAEGYIAQQVGVEIHAGDETPMNFKLTKSSAGTGVKVAGRQDGVVLFVDGKEVGPLPQELKTLAAGTHALRFKGSERYAAEERTITIGEDEIKDLGTVSLKVVRGLATFDVRTAGAKVTLVSGDERRELRDFSQPVEIDVTKNWSVEGSKPGYDNVRLPLSFEDRADKTFVIDLAEKSSEPKGGTAVATAPPRRRPTGGAKPAAAPADDDDSDKPEKPAAAGGGGNCTLNLNSIPVSNVVLDGKPLGTTPKIGISVPAGAHFIIFSGDEAKKSTSASCKAGETKTVAVRLNAPAPAPAE